MNVRATTLFQHRNPPIPVYNLEGVKSPCGISTIRNHKVQAMGGFFEAVGYGWILLKAGVGFFFSLVGWEKNKINKPRCYPQQRLANPVPRNLPRNPWFGTCPGNFPELVNRNLPRNLPGTRGSERSSEPARNLSFRTCPGTRGSEPAPEPSWNPWFGTWPGPGTFPEPVVRNLPRTVIRNLPQNLHGTCRSEPAPEPSFPEPVIRNLPRNLPGTCRSEPAPEPRNLPGTRDSEPAPEPSQNLSFGTCPGTFPEPVIRNLPRNLPGASRNLPPGSRPGTAPEPILAKTP